MSRDRARAARYVEARRGTLGLSQQKLADRAGVDLKTIYNLESGDRWPQARTRARIEGALLLREGSLQAVAAGEDPALLEGVEQPAELTPGEKYLEEFRDDPEIMKILERLPPRRRQRALEEWAEQRKQAQEAWKRMVRLVAEDSENDESDTRQAR